MTKKQIHKAVLNAIQSGNWVIRTDNSKLSYKDFKWNPIGQWTEVSDWNSKPRKPIGKTSTQRVLFCETDGPQIVIDKGKIKIHKIKVQRARILLIDDLSLAKHLNFDRGLDLSYTSLTHLPEHLNVNQHLNLEECTSLTTLSEHLTVKGCLELLFCTSLTHLPEHLTVNEDLDLRWRTSLTSLPEYLTVNGNLYLYGCTSLTHLPKHLNVGGRIYK